MPLVLRGTRSTRKVDYLLRYAGFPIAVIEAKAEDESAERGLEYFVDAPPDVEQEQWRAAGLEATSDTAGLRADF